MEKTREDGVVAVMIMMMMVVMIMMVIMIDQDSEIPLQLTASK